MIKETIGHGGVFEIVDRNGKHVVHNKIMDTVLDQLSRVLQNDTPDLEIKYLAIGTGDSPTVGNETQLGAEIFRTLYQTRTNPSTGVITHTFIVTDSEAIALWKEIGIFGGSTATITANTGTLISRVLFTKDKLAGEEVQIQRTDNVRRV